VTTAQVEIQAIAAVVAAACALPGVFLVLRRMALISDAISHAILPGIVLAFFVVEDLSSPLLVVGAAGMGLVTVVLIELLRRTELVREDAAIGLVFPVLFSAGVVLIARFADDVHLDIDAVLLGELAFAPFDRLVFWGWDWGCCWRACGGWRSHPGTRRQSVPGERELHRARPHRILRW
jgi:manganese/zinc/iron transport system permease protein